MTKLSVDHALLKAKSHAKKREIAEAQKLYKAVIQAFPKNKRAQNGLKALNKQRPSAALQAPSRVAFDRLGNLYNQGQFTAAAEEAQSLIYQYPTASFVWNILGAAKKSLGRIDEASQAFRKVTKLNPIDAGGFSNLGASLREEGKLEEALAAYTKALSLKPDFVEAHNNMGNALQEHGNLKEAIEAYTKALSLKPDYVEAHNNMGNALQEQGNLKEAIEAYNRALLLKPDYAEAHNNLGNALQKQGNLKEAIEAYNRALLLKPDYAEAHNNLGNALKGQSKLDQAIAAFYAALSFKPCYAEAHNNMGVAFHEQGKLEQAMAAYNKALSFKPEYVEAHNNMGIVLKEQGNLKEAKAAYNKALSFKPDYAEAHINLSAICNYEPNDPQMGIVNKLLARPDLKDDDRCQLHYTQAKIKEDLGEFEEALKHYVAGGELRRKSLYYDLKQDERWFTQIKNTAPRLKDRSHSPVNRVAMNTPIFILGMPRSGTTLVEQIISSHSQVQGAGELPFLTRLCAKIVSKQQSASSDDIFALRDKYLENLEKVSSNKAFVTDKMPHNFQHIGPLLEALPEAKVIHVKRCPAATCWSNFKHYFSERGLGYSYKLSDTVSYFKMYQDLMGFWGQKYHKQIYQLDYDELTNEQEVETRKLIGHLELGWEDVVLSPQKNQRFVRTNSQQQVKEMVYRGSSQAWQKFEPYLDGVFNGLSSQAKPTPK